MVAVRERDPRVNDLEARWRRLRYLIDDIARATREGTLTQRQADLASALGVAATGTSCAPIEKVSAEVRYAGLLLDAMDQADAAFAVCLLGHAFRAVTKMEEAIEKA